MSSLRPELHVAQQIRRDKLRNIQNSNSQHIQHNFPNEVQQQGPGYNNLDLLQEADAAAAALYSSEIISFASNPRSTLECQELMMPMPPHQQPVAAATDHCGSSSSKEITHWRSHTSAQLSAADWMLNYATTNHTNHNSFLPSHHHLNVPTSTTNYAKPNCNLLFTDLDSSSPSTTSGGEIQNKLGEMHFSSQPPPPLYHNALQDIFKSNAHGSEMVSLMQHHHGIWGGNVNNDNSTMPVLFQGNNSHQGLSLSLSSNSQSKPSHFEEGSASESPDQYSKPVMKPSIVNNRGCGMIGTSSSTTTIGSSYRNVGPLGPFTGYATILKSSMFLKPCQQLLDQCCGQSFASCGGVVPEWVSRDVSSPYLDNNNNTGSSSGSMLYTSKENVNSADGGVASSFCLSSRPECQKNKAKLLNMQDEVTRRYKQYHHQMQMVVSSFESVAGLSSATPYISLALKSISKHFKCLKNAISDQLKLTCEVLGEELSIPTTTRCKNDNNMVRVRCNDQRNKSGGSNVDFVEHQQHVWRPQRGLPERAVAILKAWLFEHFLHPYPTDTDKHMLATQTGLSRNQVSNWFINARVRVWKPMVEEIHMLETKGTTEAAHQNNSKNDGASPSEGSSSQARLDRHPVSVRNLGTQANPERQFQCLEKGSSSGCGNGEKGTNYHEGQWNQEKRSKFDCDMDGTLMGFMPYQRQISSGVEIGGLGSVSLTLGLRHGVEHQQQQQQLQHQEEFRRQFGGHMIHDFVG